MKRKLIGPFMTFIFLLCFQGIAFAVPNGSTHPSIEKVIYDGGEVEYREREDSPIKKTFFSAQSSDSVTFTIENLSELRAYNVKVTYQDSETDYDDLYVNPIIEDIGTGYRVVIPGLNWNLADTYFLTIGTKDRLLRYTITSQDAGKTIPLSTDESYVHIDANIPFAEDGFSISTIRLTFIDSNGVPIVAQGVRPGALVPAGNYNLQVTGTDESYGFYLTKKNYPISAAHSTIQFGADEVTPIQAKMNSNTNMKFDEFFATLPGFYSYSGVYLDGQDTIYVTKTDYRNGYFSFLTETDWSYEYRVEDFNITGNQTYTFDTNLQAKLNIPHYSYSPGEELDFFEFGVFDSFGHQIDYIWTPEYEDEYGVFEFKNQNQSFQVEGDDLVYPEIEVPNISGTFKVTFKVDNSMIPISPASAMIEVTGGTQYEPHYMVDGYPDLNYDTETQAEISFMMNESGWVYYVVVPKGAAQPSPTQIYQGLNADNRPPVQGGGMSLMAYTEGNKRINGLEPNTSYTLYAVLEPNSTSNLDSTVYYLDFKTDSHDMEPDINGDGIIDLFDLVSTAKIDTSSLPDALDVYGTSSSVSPPPVPDDSLKSQFTAAPPVIDGFLETNWGPATFSNTFTYTNWKSNQQETHDVQGYLMNDDQYFYVGVRITGEDYYALENNNDKLELWLDNNNNGVLEVGEDILTMNNNQFQHMVYQGGGGWSSKDGESPVTAKLTHSNSQIGDYLAEYKIPRSTVAPDGIGFHISFIEMYTTDSGGSTGYHGYAYPQNSVNREASTYAKVKFANIN